MQTGAKFISSLNAFQRLAYARLASEREAQAERQTEEERLRGPRQRDTTITLESFARSGDGAGSPPPVPFKS